MRPDESGIDSTILFVGYQSEGTIGRKLLDGADSVRIFGEEITVKARIATLSGSSGHADRDMLTGWLGKMKNKPAKVFVNHGDDEVCDSFAQYVTQTLGTAGLAPYSGDEYDLRIGECTATGVVV